MSDEPLTRDALHARLAPVLAAVVSGRRPLAVPARRLEHLPRCRQELVLEWTGVIARTNAVLAYAFAVGAAAPAARHDAHTLRAWALNIMEVYDRDGLEPALEALEDFESFLDDLRWRTAETRFDGVRERLQRMLTGLSGRELELAADDTAWTDTAVLYLPERLRTFGDFGRNLALYQAMLVHAWAQVRYGTFQGHGGRLLDLAMALRVFGDSDRATRLLHALETVRLQACLARDLPGMARRMDGLQREVGEVSYPRHWQVHLERLRKPGATIRQSLHALGRLYPDGEEPPGTLCYQGELRPEAAGDVIRARQRAEREAVRRELRRALEEAAQEEELRQEGPADDGAAPLRLEQSEDPDAPGGRAFSLMRGARPVPMSSRLEGLLGSVVQDLGEVPEDYLVPADDNDPGTRGPQQGDATDSAAQWHYDEWDYRRADYRRGWCELREVPVSPGDPAFTSATLRKHAALAAEIRRKFEVMRAEQRRLRRQPQGDDIDVEAVVAGYADWKSGMEMPDRLFVRHRRDERDIAAVFMVDMSGSTKGWINEAEREALVLLCHALEILGDRYAIYGFSGMSRRRCELFRVKTLDEPYDDEVRARIAGMRPREYTRMGVTIRHLTHLLGEAEARTRLLITLSDGKPDDCDGYRGHYGIEDTRRALQEARHVQVHPFCITIDTQAHSYLPHMYGPASYVVLDEVRKLPLKVGEIYRRLTTG